MIPAQLPDAREITALVFDLDGTLYVNKELGRTIVASACRHVAETRGVSVEEAERLIREMKQQIRERGEAAPLTLACRRLGADIPAMHRRFAREVSPESFLAPDRRVCALLERLSARYRLYLYTNNNRELACRTLAVLGIPETRFQGIYSIEDSWEPKPARTVLERILAENGLAPAETLFVGDRFDIDLRPAQELGSPVFLTSSVEELLELDTLVSCPADAGQGSDSDL